MNKVIKNIKDRRSVRYYDPKPIPKDILAAIIDAGNRAPSWRNEQKWRFVVIEGSAFRDTLKGKALSRYKKWLQNAPADIQRIHKEMDASVSDPVYYSAPVIVFVIGAYKGADYDCPMVCQNMMLAARSFGVGSCWVHLGQLALHDTGIRQALGLKGPDKVYGPILLGYPAGGFPQSPPKKTPEIKWI